MANKKPENITWAYHASEDLAVRLENLDVEKDDLDEQSELTKLAWDIAYAIKNHLEQK